MRDAWRHTLDPQEPERKATGPKRVPLTPLLIAILCERGENVVLSDSDDKPTVRRWLADRRRLAHEHGSLDEVLWAEDQIARLGGK